VRVVKGGGGLTKQDIELIKNRKINEIIVVNGTPDISPFARYRFFRKSSRRPCDLRHHPDPYRIEMVSGAGDAERGTVMRAKDRDRSFLPQPGLASRTSERQDTIEDLIASMAHYSAEILMQELTLPASSRSPGKGGVADSLQGSGFRYGADRDPGWGPPVSRT